MPIRVGITLKWIVILFAEARLRASAERVISGPGLFNLYQFLKDTNRGEEPPWLVDQMRQIFPGCDHGECSAWAEFALHAGARSLHLSLWRGGGKSGFKSHGNRGCASVEGSHLRSSQS